MMWKVISLYFPSLLFASMLLSVRAEEAECLCVHYSACRTHRSSSYISLQASLFYECGFNLMFLHVY